MGEKGSKATKAGASIAEDVVAMLSALGAITHKKMFGGSGIFHDGAMFCIVDPKGVVFMKAEGALQVKMEKAGAKKHGRMPYFSIPEKVLDDAKELKAWAKSAIAALEN